MQKDCSKHITVLKTKITLLENKMKSVGYGFVL